MPGRLPPPARARTVVLAATLILALLGAGAARAGTVELRRVGAAPRLPQGASTAGSLAGGTLLPVTVTLRPRDPMALEAYATGVSTAGSPLYRHFLSVPEFAARFAPFAAQRRAVRSALGAVGLTPGPMSANGLSFNVTATAGTLGRALHTSFGRLRLPDGRIAFVNREPPAVPANVASLVQGVLGLDDVLTRKPQRRNLPRSAAAERPSSARAAAVGPRAVDSAVAACSSATAQAAFDHGYSADEIAPAYGLGGVYAAGDRGAGATVGLLELEPYDASDISTYTSCYGIAPPLSNVGVDGGATCAPGPGCGGEATLDIEVVAGLAPAAAQLVYEGPNTDQGVYDTYRQMVADDRAQVISTSWGLCEPVAAGDPTYGPAAESTLFQEAAVQGQSVVAAAGDSGADDCGDGRGATVDDPASQPFVTGAGGTSLLAGAGPRTEAVWNDGFPLGATGGGVSSIWGRPSYQTGVVPAQSSQSCGAAGFACREVPDVSASADEAHGFVVYQSSFGGWGAAGGTSVAAPLWASLLALANGSPACAGTRLGFANPILYHAAAAAYASNFNDVNSGDNGYDGVAGFSAGPGYDMTSGLGTPQATTLIATLCQPTVTFDAVPAGESSPVGAAIPPLTLLAHSLLGGPVSFTASGLPPGLAVSTGGVISGIPTVMGSYLVTVHALDGSGRPAVSRTLRWTITVRVGITSPGNRVSRVGSQVRLQLRGSDSARSRLRFAATSLPAGLKLDPRSGLITGRPRSPGARIVTVRASDPSGVSASATFGWTVEGLPSTRAFKVRRLSSHLVSVTLGVTAGRDAPPLSKLAITLPGVGFASSAQALNRGVRVLSGGRRVAVRLRRLHGQLVIALARATGSVTIEIGPPAITSAGRGHLRPPAGSATDAAGVTVPLH